MIRPYSNELGDCVLQGLMKQVRSSESNTSVLKSEVLFEEKLKDEAVQACEVSSTSLFIQKNYSLYQQLTQTNTEELDVPSSTIDKNAIQHQWTQYPSPFPTRKHNYNRLKSVNEVSHFSNRLKPTEDVSKILSHQIKSKGRRFTRGWQNKKFVEFPKSQFSLRDWLTVGPAPTCSPSSPGSDQQCPKPAMEYVPREFSRSTNSVCSNVQHISMKKIKGIKQRIAVQATLKELEKEVQAYRSYVDKLRATNENILCKNERLETLIAIKSTKTCADITKPEIAELLNKILLCKPGDMGRYSNNVEDKFGNVVSGSKLLPKWRDGQKFSNHPSIHTENRAVYTNNSNCNNQTGCGRKFRKGSISSQETERFEDTEDDTMSSTSTISTISSSALDETILRTTVWDV